MLSAKSMFHSFITLLMLFVTSACATSEAQRLTTTVNNNSQTPDIKFSYTGSNKILSIEGLICRYGRSTKSQLPTLAVSEIQQYVQQNPARFKSLIKDLKQGMMGQRLNLARLNIFYLLKSNEMSFDYFVEGNQICANYQTSLTLDFKQDFIEFIELNVPPTYQFIAKEDEITAKLSATYPDIALKLQSLPSSVGIKFLVEEKKLNDSHSVYTFHYLDFQKDLMQRQGSVFVSGDSLLTQALEQYLQENGFTLATSKSSAFWSFKITRKNNKATMDAFKEFTVEFHNANLSDSGQFINDSSVLPSLKTKTDEQKINLVKLYLEMIEVAEQIRERQ